MPTWYVTQQIGVADQTKSPPDRADGRLVGAKMTNFCCSKKSGEAWAAADKVFLCRLMPGESLREIIATTDTSLGASLLSIGTLASANKYVNGQALTAVNVPTIIGPMALTLDDPALTAQEDIYMTVSAAVGGAVQFNVDLRISSIK